jgi:hypothetical protein
MNHLMKLAEALRNITEECSECEIEQALDLCTVFADRVSGAALDASEYPESLGRSMVTTCFRLLN